MRTLSLPASVQIANAISAELTGGEPDRLSTMQRHMVAAFVGCSIELDALTASMLLGRDVDPVGYSSVAATMVKLSQRLAVASWEELKRMETSA